MKLKPLGDRVVVEREEAKGTTAGGIVLPDTAKDKPQKGKVVAVGEGRVTKDEPTFASDNLTTILIDIHSLGWGVHSQWQPR
jgi:co-chaperonin GroES (HSP10)